MQSSKLLGSILVAALILSGCAASDVTTTLPPSAVITIDIVTPSPNVTPTVGYTNTPLPPPPPFPGLNGGKLLLNPLLFENGLDCKLPCWQGLEINESDSSDVQALFDKNFGFNNQIDFVHNNPVKDYLVWPVNIIGITITGYSWNLSTTAEDQVQVLVGLNNKTNQIDGIILDWALDELHVDLTPYRVLSELGNPTWAFANVSWSMIDDSADVRLLMIYQQGVSFYFTASAHRQNSTSANEPSTADFCLASSENRIGYVVLTERFDNNLGKLSQFQMGTIGDLLANEQLSPISEVFSVKENELEGLIAQKQDPCLRAILP